MTKIYLKTILFSLILICINNIAFTQNATDKQIEELLTTMKIEEQFVSSMENMVELQKEAGQAALVPEGFFEEFIKEAKAGFKTDLYPQMADTYKKNLTADEIDQLQELYSSDVGQLLLEKMPIIQMESANIGMQWGQKLGMSVAQKLMNKE